jgi:predicted glycosyltransferase
MFDAKLEHLMMKATAIVAMGGYNTFCEILSLDKRAILVPRTTPRQEQLLRANRAAELGLVHALDPMGDRDAAVMAAALRGLAQQPAPSEHGAANMLGGLDLITELVAGHVGRVTLLQAHAAGT